MIDGREVFVAGGGVAGIEALLALRDLAGDLVHVTLASPALEFVLQAADGRGAVLSRAGDPARARAARRGDRGYVRSEGAATPSTPIGASPSSTTATTPRLRRRDCLRRSQEREAFAGAETLRTSGGPTNRRAVPRGRPARFGRMVFIVPPTGSWPLPVYELALMARHWAHELALVVRILIVRPNPSR